MTRTRLAIAGTVPACFKSGDEQLAGTGPGAPLFASLDTYRPLAERAPEPQIAEARRREFFNQLHRWLRQGYAVHVFCNNDGEQQRFEEVWNELSPRSSSPHQKLTQRAAPNDCGRWTVDSYRHACRVVSSAMAPNLSSSPTPKSSGATKSSVRAG